MLSPFPILIKSLSGQWIHGVPFPVLITIFVTGMRHQNFSALRGLRKRIVTSAALTFFFFSCSAFGSALPSPLPMCGLGNRKMKSLEEGKILKIAMTGWHENFVFTVAKLKPHAFRQKLESVHMAFSQLGGLLIFFALLIFHFSSPST